jgi:hypothetical protein
MATVRLFEVFDGRDVNTWSRWTYDRARPEKKKGPVKAGPSLVLLREGRTPDGSSIRRTVWWKKGSQTVMLITLKKIPPFRVLRLERE